MQLKLLYIIMFFDNVCGRMIFPMLTFVFFAVDSSLFPANTSHAVRSIWYGSCISIPSFILLLSSPLYSFFSDTFGRKWPLAISIFGISACTLLSACGIIFHNVVLFIAGCFVHGACSKANPMAQSIVGDLVAPNQKLRAMGSLQAVIALGACLGPVLVSLCPKAFFHTLNYAFNFWLAFVISLIPLLLVIFTFRETLHQRASLKKSFVNPFKLFLQGNIRTLTIFLFLVQMSWSTFYQFLPPMLKIHFHYSVEHVAFFIGLVALWISLASGPLLKKLSGQLNESRILMVSLLVIITGFLCVAIGFTINKVAFCWLGAAPIAAGDVMIYSCLTTRYSNHVKTMEQGAVMGIGFAVVSAAWALTGIANGFLLAINPLAPLGLALLSILLAAFYANKKGLFSQQ